MIKVLIINQGKVHHFRILAYNYLSTYLKGEKYDLTVVSGGIQGGNTHQIEFALKELPLSFFRLAMLILKITPDVVIFWVQLRYLYLFPILLLVKAMGKKAIYWGHGYDLYGKHAKRKRIVNNMQYWLSDALILYGKHLKKYVDKRFHNKIFVANNTLCFGHYDKSSFDKATCLSKYNIHTSRNIICMGRMQRRKRVDHLLEAFELLKQRDIGLILVGPDDDGILRNVHDGNIYKIGAVYGDERLNLLHSADVFCLPGAVGLSIVDAFHCGLPIVTEDGDESPEIMYLKDGINGIIVPKGDIHQLASKLELLLENDAMREAFSKEARKEIDTNGHIVKMCEGFRDALQFVCKKQLARPQTNVRNKPV